MQVSIRSLACLLAVSGCYASNTVEGAASGSRLRAIVLVPESGEPAFMGWHDSELDAPCHFQDSSDGRLRCEPAGTISFGAMLYLDEGCTQRVHESAAGCAVAEYVRVLDFGPVCPMPAVPPRSRLLAVGEPVEATGVFVRSASGTGDCVPLERETESLHRLTPTDPATFVAAEVHEGTGEWLVHDELVAEDGARQPYTVRDTRRGERCFVRSSSLGRPASAPERLPCLPEDASMAIVGGALCDETWALRAPGSECLPAPELAYSESIGECGRVTGVEVFVVGAEVPEDERELGAACGIGFDPTSFTTEPAADDAVPWLTLERRGSGRIQRAAWTQGNVQIARFFHDTELDIWCGQESSAVDGSLRCLPAEAEILTDAPFVVFVDEACTVPGAARLRAEGCDSQWRLSVSPTPPECGRGSPTVTAVHRLGALADRGYRLDEDGVCVSLDATGPEVHHLESVPLTDFARMERRIE